jgi:hypothetical protein
LSEYSVRDTPRRHTLKDDPLPIRSSEILIHLCAAMRFLKPGDRSSTSFLSRSCRNSSKISMST